MERVEILLIALTTISCTIVVLVVALVYHNHRIEKEVEQARKRVMSLTIARNKYYEDLKKKGYPTKDNQHLKDLMMAIEDAEKFYVIIRSKQR